MNKAIFLDRDGVINQPILRDDRVTSPRSLQEWEWKDGIHEAVKKLKNEGFLLLVVTNQPDIVRGLYPQSTLDQFHQLIYDELQVDDLMACMHDNEHHCHCRKPKPGMLIDLAKKWNVDLHQSVFIGDTHKDAGAGKAAGVFTILTDEIYNQSVKCDLRVDTIDDAVNYILQHFKEP